MILSASHVPWKFETHVLFENLTKQKDDHGLKDMLKYIYWYLVYHLFLSSMVSSFVSDKLSTGFSDKNFVNQSSKLSESSEFWSSWA